MRYYNINNFEWTNEWYRENSSVSWRICLLIKGVRETIQNEAKEQKDRFFQYVISILGARLLGNLLTGKGAVGAGKGTARVGQSFYAALSFNKFWNAKVLSKWT